MKNSFIIMVLLAGFLMSSCRGGDVPAESQMPAPAMSVLITEINCPSLEILAGTQVAWSNKGTRIHVVQVESAEDGSSVINSGEIQIGGSFAFTFLKPGVYNYQCTPDGSMAGTITVR